MDNILIQFQESADQECMDLAVTILGQTKVLNRGFTLSNHQEMRDIHDKLVEATKNVRLVRQDNGNVVLRTKVGSGYDSYPLKDGEQEPQVIFDRLVGGLANLQGLKLKLV